MPVTFREPRFAPPSSSPVTPRGERPVRVLGAAVLGVALATLTVASLVVLWVLVGRPVENLTGGLVDGLVADVLAFSAIATPLAALAIGVVRLRR